MPISLRLPLVKLLTGFIAGISLMGLNVHAPLFPLILIVLLLTGMTGLFALVFFKNLTYSSRWTPGVCISILYLLIGYVLIISVQPENDPRHVVQITEPVEGFAGRISEPPVKGKKSVRLTLDILSVRYKDQWRRVHGRVIVYGKKNTPLPEFEFGDTLLIKGALFPVAGPLNPGQFNYKRYLARRNIYHQAYLSLENFRLIGHLRTWSIQRAAHVVHRNLSSILMESGLSDQERATAQALLLGDKSQLDDETYQSYSSSGTIHILCVSGLHVGVIYMILNFLFGFLPQRGTGKVLRFLLIILFIWFYAFLTGLSPSVLRATVMFSILIVGRTVSRNTNIYNTLAASALLLLANHPLMLQETGFQLSYLAVIGIVSLQPWINDLLTPKYWLLRRIWELLSVSMAAQLLTFPLTVHLFHQFPNYFLLANVLVVPLSGFIIYTGILVFVTSPVPLLGEVMCRIFGLMIKSMNGTVSFIEQLPYSTLNRSPMDTVEMILLYTLVVAGIYRLVYAKRAATYYLLAFSAAFCCYNGYQAIKSLRQKMIVIYSIPGSTSAGLIDGRNGIFFMDSSFYHDPSRVRMQMNGHFVQSRLKTIRSFSLSEKADYSDDRMHGHQRGYFSVIHLDGRSLVVVNDRFCLTQVDTVRYKADYLLLSGNASVRLEELVRVFDARYVIADMSNAKWRARKWKEEAASLSIPFHDTAERGAFLEKWE
ncbi:MAG TPA: ComEC/Rec2 family competence protein [Bacteroidales bacterium]|nr:ComEC/Rec2 family competence protein [Bacteroidales bacterium]